MTTSVADPVPRARGLSEADAHAHLARDDPNLVPRAARRSTARAFLAQLTHPLAVLLWMAVVLALLGASPPSRQRSR